MKRMIVFSAWALTALALAGCDSEEPGRVERSSKPADVAVSRPVFSAGSISLPGSVQAEREAQIATRMPASISRIGVQVGSRVSAGQVLVVLEGSDVQANIAAAQAQARLAQQYHDRIASLARDNAATQQELDDARAKLAQANAAVRAARTQNEYVQLRAPFAGVVTARNADPGDMALPGQPVLTLVGDGGVKLVADAPSDLAGSLRPGAAIHAVDANGGRFPARISRVVPALEAGSRRFRVEAKLDANQQRFLPGAFVRLELSGTGTAGESHWVPADAVVRRGQLTGVYTVEGKELRLRWLRLGDTSGDAVEVLAGKLGDAVVRNPAPTLADGQPLGTLQTVEWSPAAGVAASAVALTGGAEEAAR